MKVLFVSSGRKGFVSPLIKNQGDSLAKLGIDIDYIINVFNVHKDSKFGVKEMYKQKGFTISNNYVPYGVVGLSINNYLNPYQIVSIIEMIIENHNSLIINTKYHQQFISLIVLALILTHSGGAESVFSFYHIRLSVPEIRRRHKKNAPLPHTTMNSCLRYHCGYRFYPLWHRSFFFRETSAATAENRHSRLR